MNFNIPIMFLKRQVITLCLIYATVCAVHSTLTDMGDITDVIQNRFLAKSQEKVDVVFVIERSQGLYSIPGATDTVFAFVKSLLTRFEIQEDRTRVAVVTYNTMATVDFNFIPDGRAESLDKCKLLSEVDRISRVSASGWTATTDALREARDILFNSRERSQKAIFLITVGKSNIGEPPKVASRELMSLSWNGSLPVDIFALGILDANEEELSSVVSETRYAMYLDTYDSFQQLVVTLADDSEEERWVESVRDNCFSTCSPHAVCMCGLDTGLYHCGCGAGYHGNGAVCEACPLGSYRSSIIPGKCTSCPNDKTTSHVGATNASDCVCPPGNINDGSGCTVASCDPLEYVPNAVSYHVDGIVFTKLSSPKSEACQNTVGSSCHFQCSSKYRLVSTHAMVCLLHSNGSAYWYGDLPVCQEITCEAIPDVGDGGSIGYSRNDTSFHVGDTVTVNCSQGYESFGDKTRTCTLDGIWSGIPRQCRNDTLGVCSQSPCQVGSVCLSLVSGGTECICPEDRDGSQCTGLKELCPSCDKGVCLISSCTCSPGYIGASCDVQIDECLSNPCKNGAACQDDEDGFICDCPPGYEGETCSDEINECSGDPCQNSVICHDEIARYRCQCNPSYSGDDCLQRNSLDYDLLFTGDVAEYVETNDLPGLTQFSICVWIKTRDTTNAGTIFTLGTSSQPNALALYDCRNLKLVVVDELLVTTVSLNDGTWHHICVTWSSASGDWRIYKDGVSEKSGTGFQRGGVIKKDATMTIGQYTSSNTDIFIQGRSFIGEMSRLHMYSAVLSAGNVNKLSASSTPLEAKCSLSYANGETLIVAWPDFLQSLSEQQYEAMVRKPSWCGDIDECEDVSTCPENRKCVNIRFGEPQCDCLPAWAGDDCQTVVNCCEPSNPCQNGGTCTNRIGDYTCECPPGYTGNDCEVQADFCDPNPCQNGGTCLLHTYSYSCICAEDNTGQNCEKILTADCDLSPCLHGGHCIEETPSRISCQCDQAHQGDYCQTMFSPCEFDPSPCLNNGTCNPASAFENKYNCHCSTGYNAVNCDVVNPCHANPCRNHGDVCVRDENSDQGYLCETSAPPITLPVYVNDICTAIAEPCLNGGVCRAVSCKEYECDCSETSYFGDMCNMYTKKRHYSGRLKITDRDWSKSLITDEEFLSEIVTAVASIFIEVDGRIDVDIINILPGSIIVEFYLVHVANITRDDEMTDEAAMKELFYQLLQEGVLPPFAVSTDSATFDEKDCMAGHQSENGVEPCMPCQEGFYQNARGATTCILCPPDTPNSNAGSTKSSDCNSGSSVNIIIIAIIICSIIVAIVAVITVIVCIRMKKREPLLIDPPRPQLDPNWADNLLPGQRIRQEEEDRAETRSLYEEIDEPETITPYAEFRDVDGEIPAPDLNAGSLPTPGVISNHHPQPPFAQQFQNQRTRYPDYRDSKYLAPSELGKRGQEDGDYLAMRSHSDDGYQQLDHQQASGENITVHDDGYQPLDRQGANGENITVHDDGYQPLDRQGASNAQEHKHMYLSFKSAPDGGSGQRMEMRPMKSGVHRLPSDHVYTNQEIQDEYPEAKISEIRIDNLDDN